MLSTIFSSVATCYYFLARFAPGPRLISRIMRRDRLKWGVPAMLFAAPYYYAANLIKGLIEQDGETLLSLPRLYADALLSLPLLWCLVMGTAFFVLGPISLLKLVKARLVEAAQARKLRRQIERASTLDRDSVEVA